MGGFLLRMKKKKKAWKRRSRWCRIISIAAVNWVMWTPTSTMVLRERILSGLHLPAWWTMCGRRKSSALWWRTSRALVATIWKQDTISKRCSHFWGFDWLLLQIILTVRAKRTWKVWLSRFGIWSTQCTRKTYLKRYGLLCSVRKKQAMQSETMLRMAIFGTPWQSVMKLTRKLHFMCSWFSSGNWWVYLFLKLLDEWHCCRFRLHGSGIEKWLREKKCLPVKSGA